MTKRLSIVLCLAGLAVACSVEYEAGTVTTREVANTAACGNGVIDVGEVCEARIPGDPACSADCRQRFILCNGDWVVEGTPCVVAPRCGDGHLDAAEDCDDGNNEDADTCPASCLLPPGPACGNGTPESGEVCDDANEANGDYCSSNCHFVTGRCGDYVVQENEVCDDGNTVDGDYCAANCRALTGRCGDGIIQTGEACDDENRSNNDYCAADCRTDTGRCGDGVRQGNEGCDDGNTADGDLCPANCSALDLTACNQIYDPVLCPTPTDRFLNVSLPNTDSATSCLVRLDGKVFCRGLNTYGQCGTGEETIGGTGVTPVAGSYPFRQVSAASLAGASCAIAVDNSLWCWGSNLKRGLGRGDSPAPETCHIPGLAGNSGYVDNVPCSTIPIRVGSRIDWKKVVSAGELWCALSIGGELWCWGSHQPNHPSAERTTFLAKPTRIAPETDWADIQIANTIFSAGVYAHNIYAIDRAGHLWRWKGHYPGPNNPTDRIIDPPEQVSGLPGTVVSVCVERDSAVAATTAGTYALSTGTLPVGPPQLIPDAPLFKSVSCGRVRYDTGFSACGLTAEGQVYCWGANSAKQLADGTTTDRTSPVLSHNGEMFSGFSETSPFCLIKPNGETRCLLNGTYQRTREH